MVPRYQWVGRFCVHIDCQRVETPLKGLPLSHLAHHLKGGTSIPFTQAKPQRRSNALLSESDGNPSHFMALLPLANDTMRSSLREVLAHFMMA
mmetsp:Transcript_33/g.67  ORF Transcript_33/g.67 Transcript_33/m.67 type:complete len:93 (-) Transcript_33:6-284(-)